MMDKWEDEIVAEVRAVRDAYARRFAYDVRAICRDLKRSQDAGDRNVIRLTARQADPKSGHAG
ncbi:MAG: hypothetical protein ACJ75H_24475 [Thermoanaerobaculia bacterium]